jgi:hypothetical protein
LVRHRAPYPSSTRSIAANVSGNGVTSSTS